MNRLCGFKFIILSAMCFLDTAAASSSAHEIKLTTSFMNFAEIKNTDQDSHVDLNLEYKSEYFFSKKSKANLSVSAYVASYPDFAITLPEADMVFSFGDSSLRVGRSKVRNVSYLDEDWFLGVQTAFLRINPLYPEQQGRMGVTYRLESDQVFAEFYGSPISVPGQFPGFKVSNNGKVTSKNPWSRLPPEQALLTTGAELNLSYDVVDDSIPELLLDHQFGGALGVQTDYLKIVGMYSNRPSKQVDFLLDAKLQTGEESLVEIQTKPIFLREHFFGVQAESKWFEGFTVKNGFYGLVLEDDENAFKYQTSHPDYFFITTSFDLDLGKYKFLLQHLYTKERENVQDDVVYISSSRFLYKNAFSLTAKNIMYEKVKTNIGAIYSYKEDNARFFIESSYNKNQSWSFWGRLNLIHTFGDDEIENEGLSISSGMESFAALDSINLGVSYVF